MVHRPIATTPVIGNCPAASIPLNLVFRLVLRENASHGCRAPPGSERTNERAAKPIARLSTSSPTKRTPPHLPSSRLASFHPRSPRHPHDSRTHTRQHLHALHVPDAHRSARNRRIRNLVHIGAGYPRFEADGKSFLVPEYFSGDRPPRRQHRKHGKFCHRVRLSPARESFVPHLFPAADAHHPSPEPAAKRPLRIPRLRQLSRRRLSSWLAASPTNRGRLHLFPAKECNHLRRQPYCCGNHCRGCSARISLPGGGRAARSGNPPPDGASPARSRRRALHPAVAPAALHAASLRMGHRGLESACRSNGRRLLRLATSTQRQIRH